MTLDISLLTEAIRNALLPYIGASNTPEKLDDIRRGLGQAVQALDPDHDGSFQLTPAQARALGYGVAEDVADTSKAWFHFGEPRWDEPEAARQVVVVPLLRDSDWGDGSQPADNPDLPDIVAASSSLSLFGSERLLLQHLRIWRLDDKNLQFSVERVAGPHSDVEALVSRTLVYPSKPCGTLLLPGEVTLTLANLSRRPGELLWVEAAGTQLCLLEGACEQPLIFTAESAS